MNSWLKSSNTRKVDHQKEDFYATDPIAIDVLLKEEKFRNVILEPSVGAGHLAYRLTEWGHKVVASDIVDRGYPDTKIMSVFDYNDLIKWIL